MNLWRGVWVDRGLSIDAKRTGPDERDRALFDEGEVPVPPARQGDRAVKPGVARLMTPQCDQIELRACDRDSLLAADHAARTFWAFVRSLDLAHVDARIRSLEGPAGRPVIDPAVLVALWLWTTVAGGGAAREVDRLCARDNAYRSSCDGVGFIHHTLSVNDRATIHYAGEAAITGSGGGNRIFQVAPRIGALYTRLYERPGLAFLVSLADGLANGVARLRHFNHPEVCTGAISFHLE